MAPAVALNEVDTRLLQTKAAKVPKALAVSPVGLRPALAALRLAGPLPADLLVPVAANVETVAEYEAASPGPTKALGVGACVASERLRLVHIVRPRPTSRLASAIPQEPSSCARHNVSSGRLVRAATRLALGLPEVAPNGPLLDISVVRQTRPLPFEHALHTLPLPDLPRRYLVCYFSCPFRDS